MFAVPVVVLIGSLLASVARPAEARATTAEPSVRLPGHVLSVLDDATFIPPDPSRDVSSATAGDGEPLTLTFVLKRDHQAELERYLRDVYDPDSAVYRRFLTQTELADRFGPARETYDGLLAFLRAQGFTPVEESRNRLTLTVRGSRADVERAFDVDIAEYRLGERTFYANDRDPALPAALAPHVAAMSGLSNVATPFRSNNGVDLKLVCQAVGGAEAGLLALAGIAALAGVAPPIGLAAILWFVVHHIAIEIFCLVAEDYLHHHHNSPYDHPAGGPDGSGQVVGLLQFDTFHESDLQDYVDLITHAKDTVGPITNVSQVAVNGGVASPGPGQTEVLLDVAAILRVAPAAQVVVYHAPFGGQATSYAALFNAMVDDGVTIISNSWSSCESQVSLADVQGIETVLQSAAAAGISVFNASGDTGSTCLDGSPNTIGVPAGSPSATAIGGSSLTLGPSSTYGSETWWDGTGATPPTGQGGFGVSRFFTRPAYQDGLNASTMRSIPDVVVAADPRNGAVLCQADAGGCPTGLKTGGTSLAAPLWAAFTARLNQAQGENLGALNPLLYPLAGTDAFHGPASMGSDFAHVGLGSPNLNVMNRLLAGTPVGLPDAVTSKAETVLLVPLQEIYGQFDAAGVATAMGVPADGVAKNGVLVRLVDTAGNTVSGKTVALTPNGGSAVVAPASGVTSVANGSVLFEVTDLVVETVTFTVTDTTDGIVLADTPSVTFVAPPAASGNIVASVSPVTANGIATTTITVTLEDGLGRPSPGKYVTLSQGDAHSVITGPSPSVTDANGQIQFTATNLFDETVTYTALDVADGELPVPGSAVVQFTNSTNLCAPEPVPAGENGYGVATFGSGFVSGPLNFGGIAFGGCPGVSTPAFLGESVFFFDWTGDLIELPATGGAVTTANRVANLGQTFGSPVVSQGGKLYAARASSGAGVSGTVVEIDPETGAIVRTLASGLPCPGNLAIDPLSGDLFFDGFCSGSFADPTIRRIRDPDSATPTLETYATLPDNPNGKISFAPDGTMFVSTGYFDAMPIVSRVSGTDVPGPPTVTTVPGVTSIYWVHVAEVGPNGQALSLLTLAPVDFDLALVDITQSPPVTTLLARDLGGGEIGPDGCLYAIGNSNVFKLTDPSGGCSFGAASGIPALGLSPPATTPDPPQGDERTFTATLRNVDEKTDVPIFFTVTGANPQFRMVRTDTDGEAAFTYAGANPGKDVIFANATIDTAVLSSNRAEVTWTPGNHETFLTLNASPRGARPGQVVTVRASLTDSSVEPAGPLEGETIEFALGTACCTATTDADGNASCELPIGGPGTTTLTATFAGTTELVGASDTTVFTVGGPPLLGHFAAYSTKPTRGPAKFLPFGAVTLGDDAFGTSAGYDVLKPTLLAVPADKNGGGIGDPVTHLDAYAVKLAKGAPKFRKRPDVLATNQCGALTLTAAKPVALLVPAARDFANPVAAPDTADHNVDHLLCYQVKVQKKRSDGTEVATFPKGVQVDVIDEVDQSQTRRYDLKKPRLLCNPVAKSGTPVTKKGGAPVPITPATVRNPESHLVCYDARLATKTIPQTGCGPASAGAKGVKIVPKQAKHGARLGVHVADQFGARRVDTKKATLICVPSSISDP